MANVLIVRYSSLGDCLILIPIVYDLAKRNSDDVFYVLTYSSLRYLYVFMPENVIFISMPSRRQSGLFRGLLYLLDRRKVIKDIITKYRFDKIAFLRKGSVESALEKAYKLADVAYIDSDYFYSIERVKAKLRDSLTASGLYIETFNKLGYKTIIPRFNDGYFKSKNIDSILTDLTMNQTASFIVIAPFSRMPMKEYPLENIESIIDYYEKECPYLTVLLIGGGAKEKQLCENIASRYNNVQSLVGKYDMETELCILSKAKVLLTMDSANLHLASFVTTSVISIWGSNDFNLGFYPTNIPLENAISKKLSCRPCSLFGEHECTNVNKMECMDIDPRIVINKINQFL